MPSTFEATNEFAESIKDIEILVNYAVQERDSDNEKNRLLFLKLAVVSSVTKLQVFIESILKEYLYVITTSNKKHGDLQLNLRLNAIRLFSSSQNILKKLENHESYSIEKLNEIKNIVVKTLALCNDNEVISEDLQLETKFPLGKTGLEELIKLFRQIDGKNIFESLPFDINRLNEILGKRHAIIHEDSNPQLTEEVVIQYRDYLVEFTSYIDQYLEECR